MATGMNLEPHSDRARREIAGAARAMLSGALSFIEGARLICSLRWRAELADFDPDILAFIGIDSETDTLPIGNVREHWVPEALAKLQPEIDSAENWAQEVCRAECQRLIDRFGAVDD
jgi:hypothetical protein